MSRAIGKDERFDIVHKGWAPCFHGEGAEPRLLAWLTEVLNPEDEEGISLRRFLDTNYRPSIEISLEGALMWSISLLGGELSFDADQWVVVTTRGDIGGKTIYTDIQADTPLLALAETYRFWRDKRAELHREGLC